MENIGQGITAAVWHAFAL